MKNLLLLLMLAATAFGQVAEKTQDSLYVLVRPDGRIIDFIEPTNYNTNKEPIGTILRNACPAGRYIAMPKEHEADIRAIIADTTDKWRVDFNDLAVAINEPDLADSFQVKDRMIVRDAIDLRTYIKDKKDVSNPVILDRFAASIGDSSVGTAGAYATFAAAFADIANLTGDLTFTQISDVTETGTSLITEDLGGFTFTVKSNTPHNGDPTQGWVLSNNTTGDLFSFQQEGPGVTDVYGLHIKRITEGASTQSELIYTVTISTGFTFNAHDLLLDGQTYQGGAFRLRDADCNYNVWNCVLWDFDDTDNYGAFRCQEVNPATTKIENITINNAEIGISNTSLAVTYKNIVLFNCNDNVYQNTNSIGTNCATDAADTDFETENNPLENLTPANEFASLDDTQSNFLDIEGSTTGSLIDAGTNAQIAADTLGIRGRAREDGDVSIGAAEEIACGAAYDTTADVDTVTTTECLTGDDDTLQTTYWSRDQIDSINTCVPDTVLHHYDSTAYDYDTAYVVYDTTATDSSSSTACLSEDSLQAFYRDSLHIDSTDPCDLSVTALPVIGRTYQTDTTGPSLDTVVVFDSSAAVIYVSDTSAGAATDSTLDTLSFTTVTGDTIFIKYYKRWTGRTCSTQTDSLHTPVDQDSIQRTISACVGNAVTALDTFDTQALKVDSTTIANELCTAFARDTLDYPATPFQSDTVLTVPNSSSFQISPFIIGF